MTVAMAALEAWLRMLDRSWGSITPWALAVVRAALMTAVTISWSLSPRAEAGGGWKEGGRKEEEEEKRGRNRHTTTRQPDNQTTRQPDNQTTRQPDNTRNNNETSFPPPSSFLISSTSLLFSFLFSFLFLF